MTTILIPLLLFTFSAFSISYWSHKPFFDSLAAFVFTAILILYCGYILDLLFIGRLLVIAAGGLLVAATALDMVIKRKFADFCKQHILTPTILVYVSLTVAFVFLSLGKQVGLWDTLRLWGAYPKILHEYATLQLGADSFLYASMRSYPPGMPLLCYFFTSFSADFSESVVFFTYAYFGLVLLLSLCRSLTWERWQNIAVILFLIVFIPHFIYANGSDYGHYYQSLFIDPTLGLFCGYLFIKVRENTYRDGFSIWLISAALCTVTLLKDSGAFFAIVCLAAGVHWLIVSIKAKQRKQAALGFFVPALSLSFIYGSWKLITRAFSVSNHISMQLPSLASLLTVLRQFFVASLNFDLGFAGFTVSYGNVALYLLLVYTLYIYRGGKWKAADGWSLAARGIAYAGFIIGYVSLFEPYIAKQSLPSFSRYMCSLVLSEAYILAMLLIEKAAGAAKPVFNKPFRSFSAKGKASVVVLLAVLAVFSAYTVGRFSKFDEDVYQPAQTVAGYLADEIGEDGVSGGPADVYMVIDGDARETSLLHHRIYFDLIDENIRIKNFYTETDITHYGLAYTPEQFLEILEEQGYDYVLLLDAGYDMEDEFGSVFPGLTAYEEERHLYRVIAGEQGVSLELIR